jgi:hypothetical protein
MKFSFILIPFHSDSFLPSPNHVLSACVSHLLFLDSIQPTSTTQAFILFFQRPREVARWQQHFQHLSTTYLKPFFDDEMFLVATMLDRRQGVETLPAHLAMAVGLGRMKFYSHSHSFHSDTFFSIHSHSIPFRLQVQRARVSLCKNEPLKLRWGQRAARFSNHGGSN